MQASNDLFLRWDGYKFMQNNKFMQIYCEHKNLELLNINKTIVYLHKIPFFGYTIMKMHSPDLEDISLTVDEAKDKCRMLNVAMLSLITPYQDEQLRNYLTESGGTFIINLSLCEDDLWSNLKKTTRNQIRQAERKGVCIERTNDIKDFNDWWDLYINTSNRKGFACQKYSMVSKILKHPEMSCLFVSKIEDKIIGGAFLLIDKNPLYWLGATDLSYSEYRPNNLLHWEIIRWAKNCGYTYYDLGGATIHDNHGPTKFKKGFGGDYKDLYSYDIPIKHFKYNLTMNLIKIHELLERKI